MSLFTFVYTIGFFSYVDTKYFYNSSFLFSVYSIICLILESEYEYNVIFMTYLLYDLMKNLIFEFKKDYVFHHVCALFLLFFRQPSGILIRYIQMAEISSVFLNLTYIYERGTIENMISQLLFFVCFIYVRVYYIFSNIIRLTFLHYPQEYFWNFAKETKYTNGIRYSQKNESDSDIENKYQPNDVLLDSESVSDINIENRFYAMDLFFFSPILILHVYWMYKIFLIMYRKIFRF